MDKVLKYWPVVAFVATTIGGGVKLALLVHQNAVDRAAFEQKQRDDNARLIERIRILEQIEVQEHPDYWPMIWPDKGAK